MTLRFWKDSFALVAVLVIAAVAARAAPEALIERASELHPRLWIVVLALVPSLAWFCWRRGAEPSHVERFSNRSSGDRENGQTVWDGFSRALDQRAAGSAPETLLTELFARIADSVPVLMWIARVDREATFFNRRWLDFTGQPLEHELGHGWIEGIHPDDMTRYLEAYAEAFRGQTPLDVEYRHRRYDGEYRWMMARGQALGSHAGAFSGYVGSCIDITERRISEEALQRSETALRASSERLQILSSQLMDAQESERRSLARELHDVVGQDLTAFIVHLQRLQRSPTAVVSSRWLDEGIDLVERMLQHVRNLSLELRPSLLDDLGVVAALRWFLERYREQTGLQVDFTATLDEEGLSPELKTTLFRITQEAFTNIARHSEAQRVEVALGCNVEFASLQIHDDGVGFDVSAARERASQGHSLGLLGMQERVSILGGELCILSGHGEGTEISVKLPVGSFALSHPIGACKS